jgi:hypothetical protein
VDEIIRPGWSSIFALLLLSQAKANVVPQSSIYQELQKNFHTVRVRIVAHENNLTIRGADLKLALVARPDIGD